MFEDESGMLICQQPADKISVITFTIYHCKLVEILGVALRAFYSTDKARKQMGLVGDHWENDVVADLDSQLNEWLDSLPKACEHSTFLSFPRNTLTTEIVRWDPSEPDPTVFALSSNLYISYRVVQIQIHRPLMARTGMSSSSIICATSARYVGSTIVRLLLNTDAA